MNEVSIKEQVSPNNGYGMPSALQRISTEQTTPSIWNWAVDAIRNTALLPFYDLKHNLGNLTHS